jgi:hypothetical protein
MAPTVNEIETNRISSDQSGRRRNPGRESQQSQ